MPSPRVPIIETILRAWSDAFRSIRAMPAVAAIALAFGAVIGVGVFVAVEAMLQGSGRSLLQWMASPAWFVFGLLNTSAQIVLLAPLAIAVHRYVITGQAARRYPLNPLRPSYLRYVGTALALNFAYRAPDLISLLLPSRLPYAANVAIALVTFALMLTVVVVALRRITLFPAIAVHAPRASWRDTRPASAGNVARVMLVLIAVIAPAAVAAALLHLYLPTPDWPNHTGQLVLSFALVLVQLPALCAIAAALARIYLVLEAAEAPQPAGDRMQPAPA